MENFDAIIIGSGQAGTPLAKKLAGEGRQVALIESENIGGTCINNGCTPTKTLVGTAKVIAQAQKAAKYGVRHTKAYPDYQLVHQNMTEVVHAFRQGQVTSINSSPNITTFYGKGQLSGDNQVDIRLKDHEIKTITAPLIFINTGARPYIPQIDGLDSTKFYTSRTLLSITQLPEHLIIIGGGYISLEFSQIFRRLGSQVTIIEKSAYLLSKEDEDVSIAVQHFLEEEGITIITKAEIQRVRTNSKNETEVTILKENVPVGLCGSHLLIATGRTPNTEDLQLEKAGVETDQKGYIAVNNHLRTTNKAIYALGDVKGGPAFTHVSYYDYILISNHLSGNAIDPVQSDLIPYCIFTDPELGRIGLSEKQAERKGVDYSVARLNASSIARAIETDETKGFIKVLIDNKTKKIIGVTALCAGGGELMSLLQIAIQGSLTYEQLRDTMFAHPTYAEAINNLFNAAHIQNRHAHAPAKR
ncbi:mercuric reductase [Arachidicoccus terrestris]|uniref:mercuric reductase n=1 Tax=Arachidicoccus terrestris TaxID=2875539 RepID=UPI001CC4AAB5|nr:mercuric reductase [Arachidicoccus terrestris]UAY56008.1 mercuric reductase [Arachidicoccus terrestris]